MVLIKNSEPCSDKREVNKLRNKKGTYTSSKHKDMASCTKQAGPHRQVAESMKGIVLECSKRTLFLRLTRCSCKLAAELLNRKFRFSGQGST
jgi:hypothetical protein